MGEPQGFLAHGLVIGTVTFLVLGLIGSMVSSTLFIKETPNISKAESMRLGLVVVWTSIFCMWLMWACVYMHQMVPLMEPLHILKWQPRSRNWSLVIWCWELRRVMVRSGVCWKNPAGTKCTKAGLVRVLYSELLALGRHLAVIEKSVDKVCRGKSSKCRTNINAKQQNRKRQGHPKNETETILYV